MHGVQTQSSGEGNSIHYTLDDENPNLRARANVLETRKEPGPRGGDVLTKTASFDLRYNRPTGTQTNYNGDALHYTLASDGRSVFH